MNPESEGALAWLRDNFRPVSKALPTRRVLRPEGGHRDSRRDRTQPDLSFGRLDHGVASSMLPVGPKGSDITKRFELDAHQIDALHSCGICSGIPGKLPTSHFCPADRIRRDWPVAPHSAGARRCPTWTPADDGLRRNRGH